MDIDSHIVFREEQRFALWIYLLVYISTAMVVILYLKRVYNGLDWGVVIISAIAVLFSLLKLETIVRPDGLYVRFFPLHLKFRKFSPEQISEYYTLQYRPIQDYGGWGIRCGWKGGRAYNARGNKGVQLVFNNGKRLLIGSQKPDELVDAIRSIAEKH